MSSLSSREVWPVIDRHGMHVACHIVPGELSESSTLDER